jgi:hypothetical protein
MAAVEETLEETIIQFLAGLTYSKTSEFDIPFRENNGITGNVTMAYLYSEPYRGKSEQKILIIKRIQLDNNAKGVVTPTLKRILENSALHLTEIKIESIQNEEWLNKLQEKGWIIEQDYGIANASIKKGGRRKHKQTRKYKRNRSNRNSKRIK